MLVHPRKKAGRIAVIRPAIATVITVDPEQGHMSLGWVISNALWGAMQTPGQTFTFCDEGRLINASLDQGWL